MNKAKQVEVDGKEPAPLTITGGILVPVMVTGVSCQTNSSTTKVNGVNPAYLFTALLLQHFNHL